jgi:hypothetical protein
VHTSPLPHTRHMPRPSHSYTSTHARARAHTHTHTRTPRKFFGGVPVVGALSSHVTPPRHYWFVPSSSAHSYRFRVFFCSILSACLAFLLCQPVEETHRPYSDVKVAVSRVPFPYHVS